MDLDATSKRTRMDEDKEPAKPVPSDSEASSNGKRRVKRSKDDVVDPRLHVSLEDGSAKDVECLGPSTSRQGSSVNGRREQKAEFSENHDKKRKKDEKLLLLQQLALVEQQLRVVEAAQQKPECRLSEGRPSVDVESSSPVPLQASGTSIAHPPVRASSSHRVEPTKSSASFPPSTQSRRSVSPTLAPVAPPRSTGKDLEIKEAQKSKAKPPAKKSAPPLPAFPEAVDSVPVTKLAEPTPSSKPLTESVQSNKPRRTPKVPSTLNGFESSLVKSSSVDVSAPVKREPSGPTKPGKSGKGGRSGKSGKGQPGGQGHGHGHGHSDQAYIANSKRPDESWLRCCKNLLKQLKKHPSAWPFLEPVNPLKSGAPDYFDVISRPMDLGTVQKRLDSKYYRSAQEVAADVRLTFSNGMRYNPPGDAFHEMAKTVNEDFEKKFAEMLSSIARAKAEAPPPASAGPVITEDMLKQQVLAAVEETFQKVGRAQKSSRPMSKEEKQSLGENINKLSEDKLGHVIKIISAAQPLQQNSRDGKDDEEIEIDLDKLDVDTLRKLERYVTGCLRQMGLKTSKKRPSKSTAKKSEGAHPQTQEVGKPPYAEESRKSQLKGSGDEEELVVDDEMATTGGAQRPPSSAPKQRSASSSVESSSGDESGSSSSSGSSSDNSDSESEAERAQRASRPPPPASAAGPAAGPPPSGPAAAAASSARSSSGHSNDAKGQDPSDSKPASHQHSQGRPSASRPQSAAPATSSSSSDAGRPSAPRPQSTGPIQSSSEAARSSAASRPQSTAPVSSASSDAAATTSVASLGARPSPPPIAGVPSRKEVKLQNKDLWSKLGEDDNHKSESGSSRTADPLFVEFKSKMAKEQERQEQEVAYQREQQRNEEEKKKEAERKRREEEEARKQREREEADRQAREREEKRLLAKRQREQMKASVSFDDQRMAMESFQAMGSSGFSFPPLDVKRIKLDEDAAGDAAKASRQA